MFDKTKHQVPRCSRIPCIISILCYACGCIVVMKLPSPFTNRVLLCAALYMGDFMVTYGMLTLGSFFTKVTGMNLYFISDAVFRLNGALNAGTYMLTRRLPSPERALDYQSSIFHEIEAHAVTNFFSLTLDDDSAFLTGRETARVVVSMSGIVASAEMPSPPLA